jgi:hypothetical protein
MDARRQRGRLANRLRNATRRPLVVAVTLALVGCAMPMQDRAPEFAPPVGISEGARWQVDLDISAASQTAREFAETRAREAIATWRERVHQRTEADFIPWLTGYWTQEWLTLKMAWYKLNSGEGSDSAVKRLTDYLLTQYHDRVLGPVAQEVDPDAVREQAMKRYLESLAKELRRIPLREGIAPHQFEQRLKEIRAIALAPPAAHNASLYEIVHADPIARQPAYTALIDQLRKGVDGAQRGPLDARISSAALQASENVVDKLALSGGASAAAAVLGGIAGIVVSLGAVGITAAEYERERPKMEAQLRENLNAALDDICASLIEDPMKGVMAGVHYIAGRIEQNLARTVSQPVKVEPAPEEVPLEEIPQEEGPQEEGPQEGVPQADG